jgi:hypothetical protein
MRLLVCKIKHRPFSVLAREWMTLALISSRAHSYLHDHVLVGSETYSFSSVDTEGSFPGLKWAEVITDCSPTAFSYLEMV